MANSLYPLRLTTHLQHPLWGGTRLTAEYHKAITPGGPATTGESWEVWDGNFVMNGPLAGRQLLQLLHFFGPALVGNARAFSIAHFELLIKLIDANQQLSIQVHPDDALAKKLERQYNGKTEAWHILQAEPGATVVYGLAEPLTHVELRAAALDGTLERHVRHVTVQAGDTVFVPAGTIHAIGAGIVLYEVQQASDVTYRLYDWHRRDSDGNLRELHLDKALLAAHLTPAEEPIVLPPGSWGEVDHLRQRTLVHCPYFELLELALDGASHYAVDEHSFEAVTCVAGGITLHSPAGDWQDEHLSTGDTILLPAIAGACDLAPDGGEARLLISRMP